MLKNKIENLKNKVLELEKKDINLIVADFDDTIFSRKEQFETDENFLKYRGNKGNEYIRDQIGIENMMKKYYINKKYPNTITSKLRKNHDLILTAGFDEIQKAKLKSTGLDIYNHIVVYESHEKIYELIKYIIEVLQFIPNNIIIYEDRPESFIENEKLIKDILNTNIEIMLVKMESNDSPPTITKIKEKR